MAMLSIIQPNHRTAPPVRLKIIHETPTVTRPHSINVIANKLLGKCILLTLQRLIKLGGGNLYECTQIQVWLKN